MGTCGLPGRRLVPEDAYYDRAGQMDPTPGAV
jgi:hypothetical protein